MKLVLGAIAALFPISILSWSATVPTFAQGACDPSYPDVCIAPPLPDLDCSDIPYDDFRVTGTDPHGFDRDKDGIGCETVWIPKNPEVFAGLIGIPNPFEQ